MNIFFDFDGTLVDVKEKYYAVYAYFISQEQGNLLSIDVFWNMKRSMCSAEDICVASGLSASRGNNLFGYIKDKIELRNMLECDVLFDDVLPILKSFKASSNLYLISMRRNYQNLKEQTSWLGISQYFEEIISPFEDQSNTRNPSKSQVIKKIGYTKESIIIGDSGMDIKSGKDLNIRTCAINRGIRDSSILESYNPDFLVSELSSLKSIIC